MKSFAIYPFHQEGLPSGRPSPGNVPEMKGDLNLVAFWRMARVSTDAKIKENLGQASQFYQINAFSSV
jgi:hypothetical protein